MTWHYAAATLIFSIIAYLIGSLSWAIIISKVFMKEDIRSKGSGNAGATNITRNYGKKVGLIVFVLDIAKPVVAVAIPSIIMEHTDSALFSNMSLQLIGLFALIGHIYPVFFKFKGGKGAATFVGYIIVTQWILFFVGFATFWIVTLKWRKVSLASIVTPGVLVICHIVMNAIAGSPFGEEWANPFMHDSAWWISSIFLAIAWLIIVWKHKDNIKRLINGTERTIDDKNEI